MKFVLLILMMITSIKSADYIKLEVKPAILDVGGDRQGHFEIMLKASEGIHVNSQPAITVRSLTDKVQFAVTDLPKSGDYLDLSRPIKVACDASGLSHGQHRAEFVVSYTYCSDNEGWCRMGKDSISIEIKVAK
jgi:hypothetical protein